MCKTRVQLSLDYPESTEPAWVVLKFGLVDAPSRGSFRLTQLCNHTLVHFMIPSVESDPLNKVVGCFQSPTEHSQILF